MKYKISKNNNLFLIKKNLIILILLVLCLLSACTEKKLPILDQITPVINEDYCRIGVLPFVNESSYNQGDTILHKVFVAELIRYGDYLISQEGDVRKLFQQLKIFPGKSPDYEQLRIIADRLNVQLIITGRVIEMNENIQTIGVNPIVAVYLQIYDAKTGTSMWTTYHRRDGEYYRKFLHFGKINSITSLAQIIFQEVIDKWSKEGFKKCIH